MGRTPIRAKSATGLRRSNIAAESKPPADTAAEQAKKRMKAINVGRSHFDLFYLHLINGLPGARFSPGAGPMDCAWFVFDGGEGVLMPRRDLAPPVLVHAVTG